MSNINDGIFTQPGPDGIFNRGGPPLDASSPPIDSDGTPLRETLVVAYPSPGHMRVARAIRHPKSGRVEMYEEYREPTEDEIAILKRQGVTVGPGSMVQHMPSPMPPAVAPPVGGYVGAAGSGEAERPGFFASQPWMKLTIAAGVGAAAFWAVNKWVIPMFNRDDSGPEKEDEREDEEG